MSPTPAIPYLLPTVLVVEPEAARRRALLRLLRRPEAQRLSYPLSFIQAGTLATAGEQITAHRPVLLLVNPQLPDTDADTVLPTLRRMAPEARFIGVSADIPAEDVDAVLPYEQLTTLRLLDAIRAFVPFSSDDGWRSAPPAPASAPPRPPARPADRDQILAHLASLANTTISEDELLEVATRLIGETVAADDFGILLHDAQTGLLRVHHTYHSNEGAERLTLVPIQFGVAGRAVRERETIIVANALDSSDYLHYSHLHGSEIAVPLIHDGQVLGVLNVESVRPHTFTSADQRLLEAVADQLAMTIGNIRLREIQEYQLRESTALREAAAALTSRLALLDIFERFFSYVDQLIACDSAAIFLRCRNAFEPVALHNMPEPEQAWQTILDGDSPLCAEIIHQRKGILLENAAADSRFVETPSSSRIRGWMSVPLLARDEVIGMITIDRFEIGGFDQSHLETVQTLANHAAIAIDNAQLYAAEKKKRETANRLREINERLMSITDMDTLCEALLDAVAELIPYDTANVMMVDDAGIIRVKTQRGYEKWSDAEQIRQVHFALDEHASMGRLFHQKQCLLIPDTREDPVWKLEPGTEFIRTWLGMPLVLHDITVGCIGLDAATPHIFSEEHLELARALAAQAAGALQNVQLLTVAQRTADSLQLTSDILHQLNASLQMREVVPQIARQLQLLTRCHTLALTLVDEKRQQTTLYLGKNGEARFVKKETDSAATVRDELMLFPDLAHVEERARPEEMLYQQGFLSAASLPLLAHGHVLGTIQLGWRKPAGYTSSSLPMLQQIASAMGLALERSRLLKETRQQAQQRRRLNHLAGQINSLLDSDLICRRVADSLQSDFGFRHVLLLTEREGTVEPHPGGTAPAELEWLRLPAPDAWPHQAPTLHQGTSDPSVIWAPLRSQEESLGLLVAVAPAGVMLGERDLDLVTAVSDHLTVALARAHVFEREQRRLAELELVADISAGLREATTLQEMIPVILVAGLRVVDGVQGSVMLLSEDGAELEIRGVYPPHPHVLGRRIPAQAGLSGRVLRSGDAHISHDFREEGLVHFPPGIHRQEHQALRTTFSAPLRTRERTLGVMHLGLDRRHHFTELEQRLLRLILEIASAAIDRAHFHETLEQRVAARTHELQVANRRLQELDQLKSKFVADVSHEFRTPLTSLSLYLDLLRRGRPSRREAYLQQLEQQVQRLSTLVEDVLSLARLDLRGGELRRRPVSLNDIVRKTTNTFGPHSAESAVALQTKLAPDLPPIHAEPTQIGQVVSNLLRNALQYAHGTRVEIATRLSADGHRAVLAIADNGHGIPEAEMELLFDRFYRGEKAAQSTTPGTGLGLAIVREIVELHDGTIDVQSQLGAGTIFTLTFPLTS